MVPVRKLRHTSIQNTASMNQSRTPRRGGAHAGAIPNCTLASASPASVAFTPAGSSPRHACVSSSGEAGSGGAPDATVQATS